MGRSCGCGAGADVAVLHLISDTNRRGAQVFATTLNDALEERGMEGEVAALAPGAGQAVLDVPIAPDAWHRRAKYLRSFDMVVAHGSTTLDAAAVSVPRRFIYRSIGDPEFWLSTAARRLKTGASLRAALAVATLYPAASDAMARLARVPRSRLHVIPNAVPPLGTPSLPPATLPPFPASVLYVGSLSWEKQVDHIIEAVAQLDGIGLVVVGDGAERGALESLASRRLGERAIFVGAVDDPSPWYQSCDVLALASLTEGQPGCILEAATFGTPACAYAVGGIPDMIDDGVTGVLVSRDVDLTEGLRRSIAGTESLGFAARSIADQRFSLESVTDRWADLIASARP